MQNLTEAESSAILSLFPEGVVFFDLEMTGLSPLVDEIVEMAMIRLLPDGQLASKTSLFHPGISMPEATLAIHGISDEMLKDCAPLSASILDEFADFAQGLPLVGHNARYDGSFWAMAHLRREHDLKPGQLYCSCLAAKAAFPELKNHSLKIMAQHFNLGDQIAHRALEDAWMSMRLMALAAPHLLGDRKRFYLFSFTDFHRDVEQLPEHLPSLKRLTAEMAIVQMRYKKGSRKNQFRPIKLNSLLATPEGAVLNAFCIDSGLYKSYLIKHVSEVQTPSAHDLAQLAQLYQQRLRKNSL